MNFKHDKLISLTATAAAAVLAVSSLSMTFRAGAESVDADPYGSQSFTDTLELYASDAYDDPEYEKYYNAVNSPSVQLNSYKVPAKYSQYKTVKGIDVSKYQGTIDWKKVKAAGVDFAIIRAGFRGYGTGTLCSDPTFDTNMKNAIDAGIEVGVYFFSQAINETEAKEEAAFCISKSAAYKLTYPIYIDMEKDDTGRFANARLNTAQRTAIANAFCKTAAESGYIGGLYANKSWLNTKFDSKSLQSKWAIWLAHYANSTDYAGEFDVWQYSSTGSINGIKGSVDENIYFDKPDSKTKNSSASNDGAADGETESTTEETTEPPLTKELFLSNEFLGDLNEDDEINAKDATAVLKCSANLIAGLESGISEQQEKNADVNFDGKINSTDAVWILKYAAYNILYNDKSFGQYLIDEMKITADEETTETSETSETTTTDPTETGTAETTDTTDVTETTEVSTDSVEVTEATETTEADEVKSDITINNK